MAEYTLVNLKAELLAFGARWGMAPDANDTDVERGWWGD